MTNPTSLPSVKFGGGGGGSGVGLFFSSWARPLSSGERNSSCFSIPRHLGQFHAAHFIGTVWEWLLPVPSWLHISAQSMDWVGVENLSGERPDFNLIENLLDELERILGAGHSHSASLSDLTNALQEESADIPTGT